jgi:hypothetical protein
MFTRLLSYLALSAAAALALALAPHFAAAQDGSSWPADRETRVREVRATVLRLVNAIDAADGDALRGVIMLDYRYASSAQLQGLDALIACLKAQRDLEAAAKAKFGADGVNALAGVGEVRLSEAQRQALLTAPVEFRNEREALVGLGPTVAPLFVRASRRDFQWRVMLRPISSLKDDASRTPDPPSKARIERMKGVAEVLQRIAKDVRDGRLATPADARKALTDALAEPKEKEKGK